MRKIIAGTAFAIEARVRHLVEGYKPLRPQFVAIEPGFEAQPAKFGVSAAAVDSRGHLVGCYKFSS